MAFVGVACPELDLSTAIQRKESAVLAHGGAVKGSRSDYVCAPAL